MSQNMRAMVALELAKRGLLSELDAADLSCLSNEQLVEFKRAAAAAVDEQEYPAIRGGRMASTVRERIRGISIGAAVLQACSSRELTAAEIVGALEELRPGTNQASIYPEIKRLADAGRLRRIGRAEPFRYRTAA